MAYSAKAFCFEVIEEKVGVLKVVLTGPGMVEFDGGFSRVERAQE